MGISTSSYYAWLKRSKSQRDIENEELLERLEVLFEESRGTYGTRRLKRLLAHEGRIVSRRRIARLLKKAGLSCQTKRRFKVTTDSNHNQAISPNGLVV